MIKVGVVVIRESMIPRIPGLTLDWRGCVLIKRVCFDPLVCG